MTEFCEQMMTLRILHASHLNNWIAAGDRGNIEARAGVLSIHDWMKQADKMLDEGYFPGCGYCEGDLHKGEVGGWGMLLPATEGVGIVVGYCTDCITKHDREELIRHFIMRAERELGIGLLSEQ
jgi:hypothetical protein